MTGISGSTFKSAVSPFFLQAFWARILCAIWKASDPVSLRDRGVELTSGPSSSSSLWPVSSSSFSLSCAAGALHPLFLAWSSHSLSLSLRREYADFCLADKYLSCTPDGPLAVCCSSFGTRCQVFSLSSSGCSRLQLSVTSCFSPWASTVRSPRARSRSGRRLKRLLVSLRPRGSVGDGNGPRLPVAGSSQCAVAKSSVFFNQACVPLCSCTGCPFNPISQEGLRCFMFVLGEAYSHTPMVLPIR